MKTLPTFLLSVLALGATAASIAADSPAGTLTPELRTKLASKIPGATPQSIRETPIPGLYEVAVDTSVGYISADGKFVISGDLFEIASRTNLTDARKADARRKMLSGLKDDQMIVFSPATVKHTITVFTDIDCAYCRKLHSEMAELNKLGVRVRYLAYPRTGPNTVSWAKMEQVFCSKDRKQALTDAKLDKDVKSSACTTPVAADFALGEQIGVNGTPAIITDKGEYIGGYLPAAKLVQYLESGQRPGL